MELVRISFSKFISHPYATRIKLNKLGRKKVGKMLVEVRPDKPYVAPRRKSKEPKAWKSRKKGRP